MVVDRLRQAKGRLWARAAQVPDRLAYAPWAPAGWAAQRRAAFWARLAAPIHEQWGRSEWDFPLLERIITAQGVTSVLDVGCGSGRLFPLYRRLGVTRVLGLDLAGEALAIVRRDEPDAAVACARLEELPLAGGGFDLVVSNRVLQHIGRDAIAGVVTGLCAAGRLVYLNELTASDGLPEEFFMVRHDYDALLGEHGFRLVEDGRLDRQTYRLYAVQ